MENLRIVMMNGGLGNQMYQYAFLRYIEIMTGSKCFVDDSAFFCQEHIEHNGYELERVFNIKLNLLSNFFSDDVWNEMIEKKYSGISIPQQLLENGINLMLVAEAKDYSFEGNRIFFEPGHFDSGTMLALSSAEGSVYFHGYWVNALFFSIIKDNLLNEFRFPEIENTLEKNTINKRYEDLIYLTNSVAVHIRRGDFVKCGRAVSPDKYLKAIELMESKNTDCTYFVFSDDITWCKEHESELGIESVSGDIIYVEENCGNNNNYIDMQLMSKCKKMIISNSPFGSWAYYLNRNPNLEVTVVDRL